jgi:Ni/Co efflux regulator RcnB
MGTRWVVAGVLAMVVSTSGVAAAQGRGNAGRNDRPNAAQRAPNRGQAKKAERRAARFEEHDRELARNWYYHNRRELPPGLRDRDRLPPGIARRFVPGYVIERQYRERVYAAPPVLVRTFTPPPPGCRYVLFGGRFVLIDAGFRVMDVLRLDISLGR